jgi:2-oxoglutarate ferredoxin oxidoreductase subunit gamma
MLIKTVFAGFGGQGVLSMGLSLAQAAMREGKQVTYLPAYGAEIRGGTAHCTVAVGDEEIASPVASAPEFVVAMNQPSLVRFQNQIQSGGLLFVNASLVEVDVVRGDIEIIRIAASRLAEEQQNPRGANMVMLGAFIKKTGLVSLDSLVAGLRETFSRKPRLLTANKAALETGYGLF